MLLNYKMQTAAQQCKTMTALNPTNRNTQEMTIWRNW